jgi:hypothetical protein
LITTASIAVIGFVLGVYYTYRRKRDRTGSVPASRLQKEALSEMGFFVDEAKSGQAARLSVEPPDHIGPKRIEPIAPALLSSAALWHCVLLGRNIGLSHSGFRDRRRPGACCPRPLMHD